MKNSRRHTGIEIAWDSIDKTAVFALGVKDDMPEQVLMTVRGPNREVPVTAAPRMLRTAFLDPDDTLQAILTLIEKFPLPRNKKYPLSVLCKAVWTSTAAPDPTTSAHAATATTISSSD